MFNIIKEILNDSNTDDKKHRKEEKRSKDKKHKKDRESKFEACLQDKNEKYIVQSAISNLGSRVNTLESNQFFAESSLTNIYTNKNLTLGAENNIGDVNLYVETVSINRIIQAIKLYYNSIITCNDLIKQIKQNEDRIRIEGFVNALQPFVNNTFYENNNYFQILTVPTVKPNDASFYNNKIVYTYKQFESYTNTTLAQLREFDKEKKQLYFTGEFADFVNIFNSNFLNFSQYVQVGANLENYFFIAPKFNNSYEMYFSCALRFPGIFEGIEGVNPDYVIIQSSVNLSTILVGINESALLSSEYILYFYQVVNKLLGLQSTYNNLKAGVFSDLINYDLWEYKTSVPASSICLYSSLFKDWIGKPATDAIILGTDVNIASILTYIIDFNNKKLLLDSEEQVGFIQFSYNNRDLLYITKLIVLNGTKYIIITEIDLNLYFTEAIKTNGDVTIEGAVSVNNWDGSNVFNLHTEDKTLQINGRIGVNTQNPNALIDIKSLSTNELSTITNEYADLNKFIYRYFDYFIDNFSQTQNRDWTQIYDSFLSNNKISVTTINLPFDFKTTTSSELDFTALIENFNTFVFFGYTEEEFKEKYQGKTASEITEPFFQDYFLALKDYFLIIWNQKDFYLLNNNQTFTNVVNYFGGPVLRMNLFWYDEEFNVLRIFGSSLKLDRYLLNPQLNSILSEYYNSLFSCEQLTNLFTNLLRDPIIQQEQLNNPLFLTEYVRNSYYKGRFGYPQNYIFCYKYTDLVEEEKYLFHELFNYWAGNQSNKLQIPNQDILVSGALKQINNYIFDNFDTSILERIMISFYFWQFEYKVSYVKIIEIENIKYIIGSGVDILVYIKKNILSNGDQQFNGSLRLVEPSSNQTVIAMDTTEKQVAIQYPLGLGTENPRSLLTIDDVSITNLFDYLDELSKKNRFITDLSKQLNGQSTANYANIIESYIDPFTGQQFVQNVDDYFAVVNPFDANLANIGNYEYNYHWYLKLWANVLYKNVLNPSFDPVNKDIKPLAGNFFLLSPLNEVMFDNTLNLKIYNWVWGKKISTSKYFLDQSNTLRYIHTGINFNQYFSRFTSNKNLQRIIYAIQAIQLDLNELYLNYKGLTPINQNDLQPFSDDVKKEYTQYQLWVMDYPANYKDTRLYLNQNGDLPTNLDNLRPTDTIYNMLNNYDGTYHGNLTFAQIKLYYQKIVNLQQKIQIYNGVSSSLELTDSNIVGYRTDENYWTACWIYGSINAVNPVQLVNVIITYEFNVDDYLNQSIQMIGDFQMAGNLTLMNPKEYLSYVKNEVALSDLNPLISLYPEEEFVGIGSQKIFTQYPLNYISIDKQTNNVFAKNHVVVSNKFYPNLVGERIADPPTPADVDTYLQDNFSSFTIRRTTEKYSIQDIVTLGQGKFGFDISYEVEDKEGISYEIGESGMRVTSIKTFDNGIQYPLGTYFWNVIDNATSTDNIVTKDIMSLDNTGRLTVNKIRLGNYDLEAIDNGDGTQTLKWGNIVLGTQ